MGLLEVEHLKLTLGGFRVLEDVSFSVEDGEILGIIGPNGAGKTSLLNSINGVYPSDSGEMRFDGADARGVRPHRIARRGIGRTFQNLETIQGSSVLDNVMLGMNIKHTRGIFADAIRAGWSYKMEKQNRAIAYDALERVGLSAEARQQVGHLPYGKQKLVEIARAIAPGPRLLLLDEPVAGMNANEKDNVSEVLRTLNQNGLTQLLIEHDIRFVYNTCQRLAFLNLGVIDVIGDPETVLRDPKVVTAYLGESNSDATIVIEDGSNTT